MYLIELFFLSLFFPLAAVLTFLRIKQKKRGGTPVLQTDGAASRGMVGVSQSFEITTRKKWCRVRVMFALNAASAAPHPDAYSYSITLANDAGRVLFAESRALSEYYGFCWFPDPAQAAGRPGPGSCDAVLLEFLPPGPGRYRITFQAESRDGESSLQELKLCISENVWPMKKKPFIHTCADLRKAAAAAQKTAAAEE
ncbi:hypothetical protein ACFL43_04715 [Thermodesulfobacteriota bacterium]